MDLSVCLSLPQHRIEGTAANGSLGLSLFASTPGVIEGTAANGSLGLIPVRPLRGVPVLLLIEPDYHRTEAIVPVTPASQRDVFEILYVRCEADRSASESVVFEEFDCIIPFDSN